MYKCTLSAVSKTTTYHCYGFWLCNTSWMCKVTRSVETIPK